jgi:type VI secretion system Hcp family effector
VRPAAKETWHYTQGSQDNRNTPTPRGNVMAHVNENCFLDMGLKGKAKTAGFEGKIVVRKLGFVITQAGQYDDEGKNARITSCSPIEIHKEVDQTSPSIYHAVTKKDKFEKVTISFVDSANKEYCKILMEQCHLSKVSVDFSSSETAPTETIWLMYQKIEWSYGTEKTNFNVATNE